MATVSTSRSVLDVIQLSTANYKTTLIKSLVGPKSCKSSTSTPRPSSVLGSSDKSVTHCIIYEQGRRSAPECHAAFQNHGV